MDIKRTLEFFGYDVPYVASSGDEAVEKVLEIMPDLILMDIFLKEGSDGIVAASKIKELNIPLIYLTAHSEERTVERSKLTEPYGYMIKPYDSIELKYAIELAIYKNKIKKELKESEKSYRDLVNKSMVAIYKTNLKGDIIFANNAMAELFDFKSVEALKRKKIPQLYKNPKDRKKFIKKLRKESSFNHHEVNMVSNSGETINILLSAQLENNTISGMIIDITERKRAENAIIQAKEEWENTFNAVPDLIAILDTNFRVVRANKAMADRLNVTPEETVGLTCYNVVHGLTAPPSFCPYSKLLEDGQEHTAEVHEDRIGGDFIVSVSPLHDKDGKLIGVVHVARDITKRKKAENEIIKSLEEKEVLLREIHHRVKNNLQIIASLLHLQEVSEDEKEIVDVLKESEGRVKSMAMIHEKLYQSPTFTYINFKQYIEKLVYDILYTYKIPTGTIKTNMIIEEINLNIDTAIPLGLIVNELVTNSVKHAFPQSEGTITIKLKSLHEKMELTIADNGIGLLKDLDLEKTETLGLKIVNSLVNQIDGKIKLDMTDGTEFKITFKEVKYKERL